MAGHSKWTQIKHKKALTDAKKGKIFSKLVREIMVAARRSNASDPAMNPRLRAAVDRARVCGLPNDNIDRAIQRATGTTEGMELKEFLYEASAPGGIAILIEGISDNTNRTFQELRHLLAERDVKMAEQGSLVWNFEKIGTLEIDRAANSAKTPEDIELCIIDAGAGDFLASDELWIVETEFGECETVRKNLENAGVVVKEMGHDYKPKNAIPLPPEKREAIGSLARDLFLHDDVHDVYTNAEL